MLAVLVFGILGAYSNQATGNWNVALLGSSISGWGFVAAIGAALAVIHTNAMNLYPSTVDLLVALNNIRKPTRWEQPLATIGLGVLGTAAAIAGILDHVQTLITDAAIVAVVIGFVFGYWGQDFMPGFFYNTLPLPVVAGVISAILYGAAAAFWPPPQAASREVVATATAPEAPAAPQGTAS